MAVKTRVFPLYKVFDGERWRLNPMAAKAPVEPYLKIQGRFKALPPEGAAAFQNAIDKDWEKLLRKAQLA